MSIDFDAIGHKAGLPPTKIFANALASSFFYIF